MKKIMILALGITLSTAVWAQDGKMTDKRSEQKMDQKKDGVMMKDGKMMMMKDGKTSAMETETTLSNGSIVMPDGTVKMKDGKTMMLKEGECLDMDGKMRPKTKSMQDKM